MKCLIFGDEMSNTGVGTFNTGVEMSNTGDEMSYTWG